MVVGGAVGVAQAVSAAPAAGPAAATQPRPGDPVTAPPSRAAAQCIAQSGLLAATVVELYTSEGCSSCPPADRWLSRLKGQPGFVALAFHVDYWDSLGWRDRFGSPAHTARQRQVLSSAGARFAYTPQVIANGLDWPWRQRALPTPGPSLVNIQLAGSVSSATAQVSARPGGPERLSGYWAVLADGLVSQVGAGENAGVRLAHDHVVLAYRPVGDWTADGQPHSLRWSAPPLQAGQRLALVINDAATGRPLDAVVMACPAT